MTEIVAGLASSHAYTFMPLEIWDTRRQLTKARYLSRFGVAAPDPPQVEQETLETNLARFAKISQGLTKLNQAIEHHRADAIILIGDDQFEHFRDYVPQFAVYTGDRIVSIDRENNTTHEHPGHPELATHILNHAVNAGFDLASSKSFADDKLISHAHAQVMSFLLPKIPVVILFVNCIQVPSPNPSRCYEFGVQLRQAVESFPGNQRVLLYASGGLSHFSAGYPYEHYKGPFHQGCISEEFDHRVIDWISSGQGSQLATLTSRDLIENGEIELRSWITLLGALGDRKPELMAYEPFYRATMAMGVGYWPLS